MPYVEGYITPVPNDARAAYLTFAERIWQRMKQLGALSTTECWGDDIPDGQLTSFPLAVQLRPGESVALGWIIWPDRATRDAAQKVMMNPDEIKAAGDMPFDGKRMIFGGFEQILSERA